MELTHGWYGVRAVLDAPLTALLAAGLLQPGARGALHSANERPHGPC